MVEKYVPDPQKDLREEVVGVAQKLNELIELFGTPPVRPGMPQRREPGKLECAERMEVLVQRLHDDLFVRISQDVSGDQGDQAKAIDTALTTLQDALKVFIAGLK